MKRASGVLETIEANKAHQNSNSKNLIGEGEKGPLTVVSTVAESEPSVRHGVVHWSLALVVVLYSLERAALARASLPVPSPLRP